MSVRRLLFIIVALCISGATVIVARQWLSQQQRTITETTATAPVLPTTNVLVARGNLAAGQFIKPENLRWQSWPLQGIAPTYVVDTNGKLEDYVGAVVRSGLNDGEPIIDGRVVRPGDRGFMAAVLTPGMRAATVPVTVSTGVAGFIFPGDHVDLILTLSVQDGQSKAEHRASETLLTDLRILAVDQRTDDQNKEIVVAKTATLEVTPKQAETITVAVELGKLSLSLRSLAHGDEPDTARNFSHTWDSDATHLVPPPQTASSTYKVTVIRGSDMKEVEFSRNGK